MTVLSLTFVLKLTTAIAYADWIIEQIDSTQRLTEVAIAVSNQASDYMRWRTQAEDDASPCSGQVRMGQKVDLQPIYIDRRRAALRYEAKMLEEDLMVPLRRQRKIR